MIEPTVTVLFLDFSLFPGKVWIGFECATQISLWYYERIRMEWNCNNKLITSAVPHIVIEVT